MVRTKRLLVNDLDLKIHMGNIIFNVLNINYEPPVPLRYFNTHCHSSYEMHFIPFGKGTLRVVNDTYSIQPGTFYLTGPGVYHEQIADEKEPMCEYCIDFEFAVLEKNSAKSLYPNEKELNHFKKILQSTNFWFGTDLYSSWQLLENTLEELDSRTLGYYTTIQNYVSQVIVNAIRNYSDKKEADYPSPEKIPADMRRKIMDSYFRNYDKNLKPAALAKILDVSIRQLERILHRYYGMSFKEKLLGTRLEIAKNLLDNTSITVEDITAKTGFSTASYFCRRFKEETGYTPSEYRKKSSHSQN